MIHSCLSSGAGKTLEIGCGNGRLTEDLVRFTNKLVAIDPNVEELTSAQCRVENPVMFVSAFGESLPFVTSSIDTVVFTLSLHHHEPHKALREAKRVLKNDGQIIVLEPVADSQVSRLFAVLDDESEKYDLAEDAIGKSGLKAVRSGIVRTLWVFEDAAEVVCHLFSYFGLEPDSEREGIILELLGDHRELKPIPVEDTTRFWHLRLK